MYTTKTGNKKADETIDDILKAASVKVDKQYHKESAEGVADFMIGCGIIGVVQGVIAIVAANVLKHDVKKLAK